ncbi:polyprenyl diphosphate synthase [Arcanobacterium hippocoleae]
MSEEFSFEKRKSQNSEIPLHREGMNPPSFARSEVPKHVAIVMDGNGRWANAQGLPRTAGHRAGEFSLMDVIAGAIETGIKVLSVYAFSTENWKRSPREVHFLMGYSRDVIRARRAQLKEWGVKVVWSGRRPKLWKSVIAEMETTADFTADNSRLILNFCLNYGGQYEISDAVREIAARVENGTLRADAITPATIGRHLYQPELPPVDLFIRTGGERRTSNFLIWQSAYAEMMFPAVPWPEFHRQELWGCLEDYAGRERRFGAAVDQVAADSRQDTAAEN